MTTSSFLKLIELPTKVASIFPFLIGTLYTLYHFKTLNLTNLLLMFFSLLLLDMGTTALNNYMDYKKAIKTSGYNYETHNVIVAHELKESSILGVLFTLFLGSILFGLLLVLKTNIVILLLGAFAFCIALLYSFGPLAISRLPFGEIVSGTLMGLFIPLIGILIHIPDLITLNFSKEVLQVNFLWKELISIFLLSVPSIICIANIMLANNICDCKDDLINKRYTLPVLIGTVPSLKIFKLLYAILYLFLAFLIALKILPLSGLLALMTIPIVFKNTKKFLAIQTKKDTFIIAVKNFLCIHIALVLSLLIGILF